MHERYNPKMRWETANRKEGVSSTSGKFGDLSGNHNADSEGNGMNLKSQTIVETAETGQVVTSPKPPSGENKMAAGSVNKERETAICKEQNNNGDEVNVQQLKQEEISDDEKPDFKDNIPSASICGVEVKLEKLEITCSETKSIEGQMKKLAISASGDDKGRLSERSPVGNERTHRQSYNPYAISSKVLYNGGGIVAEAPAVPDLSYSDPSAILYHNITGSAESSNCYSLLPPLPDLPFCEESSSPPCSPMPDLQQVDLDALLNDEGMTGEMKGAGGDLEFLHLPDMLSCFDALTSDFVNVPADQLELSADFSAPYTPAHFAPTYRQAESIASISSPSSGSRYSSECSPLSSPVPSPGDSFASKSDSDTDNELRKIELNLQEGRAPLPSAQIVKGSGENKFLPPRPVCGPPNCYVQSAPQQLQLTCSKTYAVAQQPSIQRGPVLPDTESASASKRIVAKLNRRFKDDALLTIAKLKDEQLSGGDEHGDTQLMILIVNNHPQKLELIFAMVNRLKEISGALEARNAQNQSALLLACLFLPRSPFVARFIAEAMQEKDVPVNEVYEDGNTLLHVLCAKGDSHVDVMAELLSMRDFGDRPCFDVNQYNHMEGTPLHVAVKTHSRTSDCSRTVAFLLSQGADVCSKERFRGQTALHMAVRESCDPLLVQIVLQAAERRNVNLVNEGDYNRDTALHYAALRNDVSAQQQLRVVQLLVRYGAVSNRCGSQGKAPLALVSAARKSDVQKIIHKR